MKNFIIDEKEGKVNWFYEYNMWKNSTIFLTIWKALIVCSLSPALVVFIVTAQEGFLTAVLTFCKVFGIAIVIISVLLFISYIVTCVINGGKYIVIFEMDNLGIKHTQMNKQFTKAQATMYIGAIIGALKKDLITMGSNLLASSKNSIYSEFKKIREIKSIKKRNTIKIRTSNGFNNQVYIDKDHYDIILKMIIERSPKNTLIK